MRASLFASATVRTLQCKRRAVAESHGPKLCLAQLVGWSRTERASFTEFPTKSFSLPERAKLTDRFGRDASHFGTRVLLSGWRCPLLPYHVHPCVSCRLHRALPPDQGAAAANGEAWLHEIKHDGFRVIARKDGGRVRLYSRPGNDLTDRFPLVVEALARVRSRSCIIHGEAVACDDDGRPSFERIRYRRMTPVSSYTPSISLS
jgi:hypothetical protein